MIALIVITDGRRDCIEATVASAERNLYGPISERWIYDDSGDADNTAWLAATFPQYAVNTHPHGRQGFGGAIRAAWTLLRERSAAPYIFHLEDDFTFNRLVPLDDLMWLLDTEPAVAQVALRRQAWNAVEQACGGVVEANPDGYVDRHVDGRSWLQHRLFWTTNPSLYRRSLIDDHVWPSGDNSEGRFGLGVLADRNARCAYWGARNTGEWVRHIGDHRTGTGY